MRGAQHAGMLPDFDHGIIPAYAGSTCPRSASSGEGRDHPRVCGEHSLRCDFRNPRLGSSPRMRGAPGEHIRDLVRQGIIPAYAGSTDAPREPRQLGEDHPRVCGEHSLRCDFRNPRLGSSPRMRGAHNERDDVELGVGIIPAYAGSTRRQLVFTYPHRDHPRVCGEHAPASTRRLVARGSSPRMRGAHTTGADNSFSDGIIPAYAGSTSERPSCRCRTWDHPRVCGEHRLSWVSPWRLLGSSPRMRGAQRLGALPLVDYGIIPAYAGSTVSKVLFSFSMRDHPRVCGEHVRPTPLAPSFVGSSPRMRGALCRHHRDGRVVGIIPAYAGSTCRRLRRRTRCRDHPRVCGEHAFHTCAVDCAKGSSPRMRGARAGRHCR